MKKIIKKVKQFIKSKKRLKVDRQLVGFKRQFSARTFTVDPSRKPHVNVFVGSVDPPNFFGGYLAMYNLAKKFYEGGHAVRIIAIEQKEINPDDLAQIRRHDSHLKEFLSNIEFLTCYDQSQAIAISDRDIFVATSMVSAHIASDAVKQTIYRKFVYLTQEYEPIFFENGPYKIMAELSYGFDFFPIISTDILQKFYLQNEILPKDNKGLSFNNPVLQFDIEKRFEEKRAGRKKLLFYARTQSHASRNLFTIACLAIDRAYELGHFREDEWEIIGIGAEARMQLLPCGLKIKHIGKFDMQKYHEILPQYDLGFSLMHSPHPSLLPIEMASAGMMVVTNTYDIKDHGYFHNISPNINAVPPGIESLAQALIETAPKVDDFEGRLKGSKVSWPHTWEQAMPATIIDQAVQEVHASEKE